MDISNLSRWVDKEGMIYVCVCVCVCVCIVLVAKSCPTLVTLWTVASQAPLSMGFPRQEYWSGLPFPSPGHLPDPRIKPVSPALAGGFFITESPGKPCMCVHTHTHTHTHTHRGILLSHKREWNPAICRTWIELEGIMLIEISQTEKGRYCMISLICGI